MEITNQNTKTKKTTDRDLPSARTDDLNNEPALLDNLAREARRFESELEIERDARLRLAAENQNYRRRTEHEKTEATDRGKRELLTELLSIVDDLELARDPANGSHETVAEGAI